MSETGASKLEQELHEMMGAVDILDILREQIEQWLDEAQDRSKHEALENVLLHIEAADVEYKRRRDELRRHLEDQA